MFGWLKKKQISEQKKLLFQNNQASQGLVSYFAHKGDADTTAKLIHFTEETRRIALSVPEGQLAAPDDTKRLLDMNGELRRLYDQTAMRYGKAFDDAHKPILGWDN